MGSKYLLYITILCLSYVTNSKAFVINKRTKQEYRNEGANQLAKALSVIETQKRNLNEAEVEQEPWGYPYEDQEPVYTDLDREPAYTDIDQDGYPVASDENAYYDGSDYLDKYDPSTFDKLLEYYYDAGSYPEQVEAEIDSAADKGDQSEPDSSLQEADEREIENILNDNTEGRPKKNIDWTPKALGFEGLKHKRTESEEMVDDTAAEMEKAAEDEEEEAAAAAVEEAAEEELKNRDQQSQVQVSSLSDEEVNRLLSDANDAQVKSITNEMSFENNNGKETVSANKIVDILKDDDEGNPKEVLIETKVPPQTPSDHLNKELLVQDIPPAEGALATIQKRANSVFDIYRQDDLEPNMQEEELELQPPYLEEDDLPSALPTEVELLRECLMKYIEFEDKENTALAEALNWATMAQFDQTDAYIPVQVQYLKKAVEKEETLVELRRKCFNLATDIDEEEMLDEESYEEVPDKRGDVGFPLVSDEDDEPEDEMPEDDVLPYYDNDEEEYVPSEAELEEAFQNTDPAVEEANYIYNQLTEDEIAQYLAEELKQILLRKGVQFDEVPESDDGEWLDDSVDDEDADVIADGEEEYHLNPFLRELINKYRENKLQLNKRTDPEADSYYDYDDDAYIDDSYYGDDENDDEGYNNDAEICPAVQDLTDGCASANSLGWVLDMEAVELCNRHQLCYICGAAYDISQKDCDRSFLTEAYTKCGNQINDDVCIEQADVLLGLMFKTHSPLFYNGAPRECDSQCTVDYISSGNPFRK